MCAAALAAGGVFMVMSKLCILPLASFRAASGSLLRQRNFGGFIWGTDIERNSSLIGGAKRFQGKNSWLMAYLLVGSAPSFRICSLYHGGSSGASRNSPAGQESGGDSFGNMISCFGNKLLAIAASGLYNVL
jgi:hypothetical protein